MKVSSQLTVAASSATITTPKECNGVQVVWSVVDATSGALVDASPVSINMFVVGPGGNDIPFDVNPAPASDGQIRPTTMGASVKLKITAVGLTTQKVLVNFHYMF